MPGTTGRCWPRGSTPTFVWPDASTDLRATRFLWQMGRIPVEIGYAAASGARQTGKNKPSGSRWSRWDSLWWEIRCVEGEEAYDARDKGPN